MLSKIKLLILFIFLLATQACQQNPIQNVNPGDKKGLVLSHDFIQFYDNFHSDSSFQVNHIVFPLEGFIYDEQNNKKSIIWTRDNWKLNKAFDDMGGTFTRSYTEFGGIISEKIADNNQISSMERRFSKILDEWHLIYYDPIHLARND